MTAPRPAAPGTAGKDPGFTPTSQSPALFDAGSRKLAVMSIVTLGLYEIYWAYKQWVFFKVKTGKSMMPFWRGVFGALWGFSLFKHVADEATERGVPVTWSANTLGFAYLVLMVSWRLPDPWWLVSLFSFLPMLLVARTIEELTARSSGEKHHALTGMNYVGIVMGGIFLALAVIGSFMPATAP